MTDHLDSLRKLVKFFDMEGCICDGVHYDENDDEIVFVVDEVKTDPSHLKLFYKSLPARFPPLFETLILNFRWDHRADTELCTFFPNPLEEDLSSFKRFMFRDDYLTNFCLQHGYMPFAEGPDINYDRFCFNLNKPSKDDYAVVQIDHEEVLSFNRIGKPIKFASSFEVFVRMTIEVERPLLRPWHFRD